MGSLTKKITKRAERFNKALEAINKTIDENKPQTSLPGTFDLESVVAADVNVEVEKRRKARNKKKARG